MNISFNRLVFFAGLLLLIPRAYAHQVFEIRAESLGTIEQTQTSQQQTTFYINHTELLSFAKKQTNTSNFQLRFNLNNQHQWDMVLKPSKVLATAIVGVNHKGQTINLESDVTYQGYLKDKPKSTVRMTISKHLIHAVVNEGDKVYILESKSANQPNILSLNRGNDSIEKLKCGATDHESHTHHVEEYLQEVLGEKRFTQSLKKNATSQSILTAKLAFVCDVECLAKQSGNKENVSADVQTIVNVINGYYSEYDVQYELQPIIFIETASNPWTNYPEDQVKHTNAFAGWASNNISVEHNVAMLLTGVNQNGINYAFLGHMCPGDNYRYGMHDYGYSQGLQQRGNLITHELGHLWGAEHISPADPKYIMNASIFDGSLAWKDSTKTVISNAVQSFSACLDDGGPADPYCAVVTKTAQAGSDYISSIAINNSIVHQDDIRIVPRGDYTSTVINLDKSTNTNLTITPNNSFDASVIGVWIDWNQDNDLDDANEMVGSIKGKGPYTFNITPPANANLSRTRLRIRLAYDGDDVLGNNGELALPCGEFNYDGGETEDYTVNITDGNQAPVAAVANATISVFEGESVTLDATNSSDPDEDDLNFAWAQTTGNSVMLNNENTALASFTAPNVATTTELTFEVTVTDTNGAVDTATVSVTINTLNTSPIANVSNSSITVVEGNEVSLNGSNSSDPDGDTLSFVWTQTSGTSVTLNNANSSQASFTAPEVSSTATYTFLLTVTDTNGATDTATVTVTVNDSVTTPPTTPTSSSGGGSLSWILVTALLWLRRFNKNK